MEASPSYEQKVIVASYTYMLPYMYIHLFEYVRHDGLFELFMQIKHYITPVHSLLHGFSVCEGATMALMQLH